MHPSTSTQSYVACGENRTALRRKSSGRRRHRLILASSDQNSLTHQSLGDIVRKQLEDGKYHPYIYQRSLLASTLQYQNDFHALRGAKPYIEAATIWFDRQQRLLPEVETELTMLSQLSPTEVVVKWKVSWVRPSAAWILTIGKLFPNIKLEFKDILHKVEEESRINWQGLQKLLTRAVKEGVLEVPIAVILGTTRLTFSQKDNITTTESHFELTRVRENLDLVSRFENNTVKNRTITRDLLLFLLVRQPPGTGTEEWLRTVKERIDVDAVPGMNMFTVDGQTDSQRAQVYEDATAVLAYITFSVIVVGVVLGYTYLNAVPRF